MVSLWPWRQGDSTSAESFERTLSALATKISKASARNDRLRQRGRKLKVGWTLYGGFAYILALLILTLVTGWSNWGAVEYTTIAGGPVVLYTVRYIITGYYSYRTNNSQDYLDNLNKERDTTIEKLKEATKYDSTQKLLEKYGSTRKPNSEDGKKPRKSENEHKRLPSGDRVFIQPPPTANIQRNRQSAGPHNGEQTQSAPPDQISPVPRPPSRAPEQHAFPPPQPAEEFAPNAYDTLPNQFETSDQRQQESRWYDRILDALLGEDEVQAKNRFALICNHCRLVNGLAPPGAKSLVDVGKWRCSGCGSSNGEDLVVAALAQSPSEENSSAVASAETVNAKDEAAKVKVDAVTK